MTLSRRTALALPALLGLVAAGCTDVKGTDGKQYIDGPGRIVAIDEEDRSAPLDVAGKDLAGDPLDFTTYRGKVVLATIWGSWCPPCRTEMPKLVELDSQLDATKAVILGVNIREDGGTSNPQDFADSVGVTFPSFFDPSSSIPLAMSNKLGGPYTVPASGILDRQGRVAGLVIGAVPGIVTMRDVMANVYDTGNVDG